MKAIKCNKEDLYPIKKVFLVWKKPMYQVFKHFHIFNYRQCFISIKSDVLMKEKLSVKDEYKILPEIFRIKNGASKTTEIEWRWVEDTMQSKKVKDFSFFLFNNKSKLFKKWENNIITTKRKESVFLKDFSCDIKSPSSTKERNKTGIFRFFALFSKMWKIDEI